MNIVSFQIHMELELGMLGASKKLVKEVVQLRRQNFEKRHNLLFLKAAQTENYHFRVAWNFRG
jgi:hypothetical protein